MKLGRTLRRICAAAAVLVSLEVISAYAQTDSYVRREPGNRGVIVFVHGITGDSRGSWTSKKAYWPEMLTHDPVFNGQDIYVYHYESSFFRPSFSIDEIANNMDSVLTADGVLQHDQITFVSHSMGGIVTRAFILRYRTVVPRIRMLYFFATPSTGSSYAKLVALASQNPQFRDISPMEPDGYLAQQFSDWQAAGFKFKSYCAYETQHINGQIIVELRSAIALCTQPPQPIDADHRTIVKPEDRNSTPYVVLKAAFMETRQPTPVQPQHVSSIHQLIVGQHIARGKRVSAVAFLDVGGSPTQELIPDPPGWREPTTLLKLDFTDSPSLTDSVRNQMTRDISAFHEYLISLGLSVPEQYPRLGISNGPGSSQEHTAEESLPAYRSDENITEAWVLDRRSVTNNYASYTIRELLRRRLEQHPAVSDSQDMVVAILFSKYFNWSFWDYKPTQVGGYWSSPLWDIRQSFDKRFTDKLVAFTLRIILDSPEENANADFDLYFYNSMLKADHVVDGTPDTKLPVMRRIIESSGISLAPKARLEFSATALANSNGTISFKITATNNTEVEALQPTVQLNFADAKVIKEPDRSKIDPSAPVQSARIVELDPIRPHGKKTIEFAVAPLEPHLTSMFLNISYACTSCSRDSYDHSLRFQMEEPGRLP